MIHHLACIMDGNRRWAAEKNLYSWQGHQQGVKAFYQTVEACLEQGIGMLSVYALSVQNLSRPAQEVSFLFSLFISEASHIEPFLYERKIKVVFKGDRSLWPAQIKKTFEQLEEKTKEHTVLQVNILVCYGAQEEIVHAAQSLAVSVQNGEMSVHHITKDLFAQNLWLHETPPDLIIRTGKEFRLSNFLLYQGAYSEFYFADIYWPDITKQYIKDACSWFFARKRRFGS